MSRKLYLLCVMALLSLLVGSSRAIAQEGSRSHPLALAAPMGTAFTYQGHLVEDGLPAEGTYDLRFILYDAALGGAQVGGILELSDVSVSQGNFTVQLDFGAGIFNGQALWLEVGVRAGDSSGEYTLLSPRQALAAAPNALYSQSAPWSGLLGIPTGFADGVDNNTTYTAGTGLSLAGTVFSADTTYLQQRVTGSCAANNSIRTINEDGTVVCEFDNNAGGDITSVNAGSGLLGGGTNGDVTLSADTTYLQSRVTGSCAANNSIRTINEDGTVVCEFDNNSGGDITSVNAGSGLSGGGTNGDVTLSANFGGSGSASTVAHSDHDHMGQTWTGVDNPLVISGTFSAADSAPLVLGNTAVEGDGLLVASASNNGVEVGSAYDGIHLDSVTQDGVEVVSAGYGLWVDSASSTGVGISSAGNYGVGVYSAIYIGMYANTTDANGYWGFYTPDRLYVGTTASLASISLVAQVTGSDPLAPGDLVAAVGLGGSLPDSSTPLPLVRLADEMTFNGVIGVVESRMAFTPRPAPDGKDVPPVLELRSAEGAAQPGDYVSLTVLGVAQVKFDPAAAANIQPGMRLTASGVAGTARPLRSETLNGMPVSEGAPVVGIVLAAPEPGQVTIPVFVTLR
jgi:hypothetical protein